MFLALSDSEVDDTRHFPIRTLFDIVGYRKACGRLEDQLVTKIDKLQERFREYTIQSQTFESDDRNTVAIVFERINRAGTELDVFELLSAWSWSDDFDLVEKFGNLQDAIAEHGYADLCDEKDLQLRICAGVITGETSPSRIVGLQGEEIRNNFEIITNGILGAIDFLKRELRIAHYKLLPFPSSIVPLSCFFATDKKDGQPYSDIQKEKIKQWFWRSTFNRRYSSDVNQRQSNDIKELLLLRNDQNYEVKFPSDEIRIDFEKANFSRSGANSKALILMLIQKSPHSFISGGNIEIGKVLKKGSKHEFHHIFPKKYLSDKGYERTQINVLSNICFLIRSDNNKISKAPPSEYIEMVNSQKKSEYLNEALCPNDLDDDDYEKFIEKRTRLLKEYAQELMG